MTIPSSKFLKLVRIYLDRYMAIPAGADDAPLKAADNYDTWFRTEYMKQLESLITIVNGRWSIDRTAPGAISQGARLAVNGVSRIITEPATVWVTENYPQFWRQGLEGLWTLNLEMQGKSAPKKITIRPKEVVQIQNFAERQIETLQDHAQRHRRQVGRAIGNGLQLGWTSARFLEAMTSPDGHIVGFPYGNSRYSWHEHMRRMILGRSKTLAQAAVEYRMAGETNV